MGGFYFLFSFTEGRVGQRKSNTGGRSANSSCLPSESVGDGMEEGSRERGGRGGKRNCEIHSGGIEKEGAREESYIVIGGDLPSESGRRHPQRERERKEGKREREKE